jgi:hypothetical protein
VYSIVGGERMLENGDGESTGRLRGKEEEERGSVCIYVCMYVCDVMVMDGVASCILC